VLRRHVTLLAIDADAEVLSDVGCCDALSDVLNPVDDCCAAFSVNEEILSDSLVF
jgi:hypothetical protein